jgi:hypothetical protein
LPPPPARSRVALVQRPGQVCLVIPAGRAWSPGSRRNTVLTLLLVLFFVPVLILFVSFLDREAAIIAAFSYASALILIVLHFAIAVRTGAVVTVAGGRLCIADRRVCRTLRWEEDGKRIAAIGEARGLWIAFDRERKRFFRDLGRKDVRWIAAVLRGALGVPEELPAGLGEVGGIAVFRDGRELGPGILSARPWELVLRRGTAPFSRLRFRSRRVGPPRWWARLFPSATLAVPPGCLTCRIWEDGSASLLIAPAGYSYEYIIRAEDKDALERLVAVFGGAKEEP